MQMFSARKIVNAALTAMLSALGVFAMATPAHAVTVVENAAAITAARPGEGVIRIVTRVCGRSLGWQAVAAANGIRPPVYLVRLGQRLTVNCPNGVSGPAAPTPAVTSSAWVNPLPTSCIGGPGGRFGADRGDHIHAGQDLGAGYGTPIRAAHSGTVSVGYQAGGAGNYTMIVHGGGLATVYMHESRFAIRSGHVNAGQVIGYVGATGRASGPHLHLEVHTAGLWHGKVDPVPFLAARGVVWRWC